MFLSDIDVWGGFEVSPSHLGVEYSKLKGQLMRFTKMAAGTEFSQPNKDQKNLGMITFYSVPA